ncbi:MAG: GntR family transcriptional regulator [Candidatus Binataceae bacterium]|nr:GntR family transcriptional regulator [Candidatus Binataceae bacterium]
MKASKKPSARRMRARSIARRRRTGNGLPLYKRIKLEVTRLLSSGKSKADEPLPTEKEFAAKFRASVGTVRRAMDDLVAEHIVVRQQGRGTYLAPFSAERLLNRFWPVHRKDGTREIPIVQTLLFATERADAAAAEALQIRKGDGVYRIVNLLLMGGNPVMLDDVRIAKADFPGLTEQSFISRETTMYGLYQSRYGLSVIRTLDRLTGVPADAEAAHRLAVPLGAPLLAFTRIAYTFGDKPVEYRRTLIHTAAYEYRNAIGGESLPAVT